MATTSGFTLIELLIVMSLLAVIAAFSAPLSLTSLSHSTLLQERDVLVSLVLMNARSAALVNRDRSAQGVFIDQTNRQYVLFNGSTYTQGAPSNRLIPFISQSVAVSNSGGDTIIFAPHTGTIIKGAGTISVGSGIATHTVTTNDVGMIDW
ncbi:type II secretion system GspH family protein [Patescibacteria group bacterium]|nr:type II secretion system GspH family protein [Patescibacteria group bacterium]